jgi:hypothetical protein
MVSIAPSISASFMRVTWMGIVKSGGVSRNLETSNLFVYHGGSIYKYISASIRTGKRRFTAMIGAGRVVELVASKMWIGDEMGRSKRRSRALRRLPSHAY